MFELDIDPFKVIKIIYIGFYVRNDTKAKGLQIGQVCTEVDNFTMSHWTSPQTPKKGVAFFVLLETL